MTCPCGSGLQMITVQRGGREISMCLSCWREYIRGARAVRRMVKAWVRGAVV